MKKETILSLINEIKEARRLDDASRRLPDGCFFLENGDIVSTDLTRGVSRYPYVNDGLAVWVKSSGYINACEGMFTLFRESNYNEDTSVAFFGGVGEAGEYRPISITGVDRCDSEGEVKRYTVFSDRCAYYIANAEKEGLVFAVRIYVSSTKHICFSVIGINNGKEERKIYLATYIEAMLRYIEAEGFFNRMTKYGRYKDGNYILTSLNAKFDSLLIGTAADKADREFHTVSRDVFLGRRGRNLTNAISLRTGEFEKQVYAANTTVLPCAADIYHYTLLPGESASSDYEMCCLVSDTEYPSQTALCVGDYENEILRESVENHKRLSGLDICFDGWNNTSVNSGVMNRFIGCVKNQVDFCAMGKNYAGPFLGIRDVYQQLECALMWDSPSARKKIVSTLNYILSDGRAPRQISFATDDGALPQFDMRPFIDQGVWIISTVYTYLAFTGDMSLLREKCSYYEAADTYTLKKKSDITDTVLEHILKITDYLISNIDSNTGCLHALFGDWNDALCGLGGTKDKNREFGDGVSVMASFQLYENLWQVSEILAADGADKETINKYLSVREKLGDSLQKKAVHSDSAGNRRVVHGWGDHEGYYVGSFCDCDKKDRISLTANSFCAISGFMERDISLKKTVEHDMEKLEAKYGYLTFSVPFPRGLAEVGRISTITPGTYENCCVYVHGAMFGAAAQFCMGDSENAWKQTEKSLVITQKSPSLTSFVMPNSYCFNTEYGMDGESMGDWYTGSGCVLIKNIVKYAFGVRPGLKKLTIIPPSYFPSKRASVSLDIHGCRLNVAYENKGMGRREILVNGKLAEMKLDELSGSYYTELDYGTFDKELNVTVTD